jgi:hypothetical protein
VLGLNSTSARSACVPTTRTAPCSATTVYSLAACVTRAACVPTTRTAPPPSTRSLHVHHAVACDMHCHPSIMHITHRCTTDATTPAATLQFWATTGSVSAPPPPAHPSMHCIWTDPCIPLFEVWRRRTWMLLSHFWVQHEGTAVPPLAGGILTKYLSPTCSCAAPTHIHAAPIHRWQAKICVRAEDAAAIQSIATAAAAAGLPHYVVRDAGKTQIAVSHAPLASQPFTSCSNWQFATNARMLRPTLACWDQRSHAGTRFGCLLRPGSVAWRANPRLLSPPPPPPPPSFLPSFCWHGVTLKYCTGRGGYCSGDRTGPNQCNR